MKKIGKGPNGQLRALKWASPAILKTVNITFLDAIVCGLMLGFLQTGSYAQENEFKCAEECQTFREDRTRAYEECIGQAEALADRMAMVRHKQHCRQRYPVLNCEQLPSCKQEKSKTPITRENFEVSGLTLAVLQTKGAQKAGQNIFYPGQTVWARYEVKIGKTKGARLWFDQNLLVTDDTGKEIFRDKASYGREIGLSSTYSFKASFNIPEDFSPGRYHLKIDLRERFSLWQSAAESSFQVIQ